MIIYSERPLTKLENQEFTLSLPLAIPLLVQIINDKPAIEMRRKITDTNIIKALVSAAFSKTPVYVLPVFSDSIQSLNSLLEKGIIHYDRESNKYEFLI